MLRTRIKQIGGSNLGKDFNGGRAETYSHNVIHNSFLPNFFKKKKKGDIGVFSGGLLHYFIRIAILTHLGEVC